MLNKQLLLVVENLKEFSHEFAEHWYYNPTPLLKSGGLWPIRSGHNLAKPNYKMGPRLITYFSIHFILEGEGVFKQNNTETVINKGDLFCLFPNQTHYYSTNPNNKLKMFWLAFDGKQAIPLLNRIGLTQYSSCLHNILNDQIVTTVKELSDYFKDTDEPDDLLLISMMYKLFHQLYQQSNRLNLSSYSASDWLQKGEDYMDMHFAENITVTDVAKYIDINRSHFTTAYTKKTGMTPSKYIYKLRMEKAIELITDDSHTITEIALTLGYSDLYSFSRAFKKYYGISPNQYKKTSK